MPVRAVYMPVHARYMPVLQCGLDETCTFQALSGAYRVFSGDLSQRKLTNMRQDRMSNMENNLSLPGKSDVATRNS